MINYPKCKRCGKPCKYYSRKYCSIKCYHESHKMEKHSNWKGGKRTNKKGYIFIYKPKHHRAGSNGYVYEHVLIAEKKYKKKITNKFDVHHIDENKSNNHPDNLLLCTPREHHRYHKGWIKKKGDWYKICSMCKKMLRVDKNNFYFRKTGRIGKIISPCKRCNIILVKRRRSYAKN